MFPNKKLSITIITYSFPSIYFPISGIFVRDHADYLMPHMDVKIIAPKPKTIFPLMFIKKKWKQYHNIPEKQPQNGYDVIRPEYLTFPWKYFYHFVGKYFWNSVKDHLNEKTDIFHVHFVYPSGTVIPHIKKLFPRKTVFLSIHGNDWYLTKNNPRLRQIIYNNLSFADKILTVGRGLKEDIINTYPELRSKLIVFPNGVNKDIINTKATINTFSSKDTIKILMVGAYVKGKGLEILLKALHQADPKNYELVVIGNILDKNYYDYSIKLRDKLFLTNKVTYLISRPRNEVYQYMRHCDYFILPSIKEGFGIALIEALIFGKPVISTYSGGPEDIVSEKNGILVSPGDVSALAGAIETMNKKYLSFPSKELSKDIQNRFEIKKISKRLLNLYRECSI